MATKKIGELLSVTEVENDDLLLVEKKTGTKVIRCENFIAGIRKCAYAVGLPTAITITTKITGPNMVTFNYATIFDQIEIQFCVTGIANAVYHIFMNVSGQPELLLSYGNSNVLDNSINASLSAVTNADAEDEDFIDITIELSSRNSSSTVANYGVSVAYTSGLTDVKFS